MQKIDWLHHTSSRQFIHYLKEVEKIPQPFDDDGILTIQDKLLSCGFQYLRVTSVTEGRELIQTFLTSLAYQHVGCLTLESRPGVTDIYSILELGEYLEDTYALQEYFLNHFHCDFLWVEATKELLMSDAFERIKQAIISCAVDSYTPILIYVYD